MAKWGKGDPRWIVEDRPDGTNVNNWHWTEKNASHWSRLKFEELFVGLNVNMGYGQCKIAEILKCEGDAIVNNRKGKLIFFYDWNIEMKLNCAIKEGPVKEGLLTVCNFTEEIDVMHAEIVVHFDDDGEDSTVLEKSTQSAVIKLIQERLSAYVIALKKDFARYLILPSQYQPDVEIATTSNAIKTWHRNEKDTSSNLPNNSYETTKLHTTESFKCTAEEMYRAMTVKELVQAFTQGECVLESSEGGKFELFDGNVQGYFVELQPFRRIVLKWRFKSWPNDHFSDVVLNFVENIDCTVVSLFQSGIPKEELENTKEGWKRYYWNSMRRSLGFGAFLF